MATRVLLAVLALATVAFPGSSRAEDRSPKDPADVIQMLRSDVRAEKRKIIADNMALTDKEAKAFWPVYDRFQAAMTKIGDQRVELIREYLANESTMNNRKAFGLSQRALDLDAERLATIRKYLPQFQKAISARRAAKFFQIENQINRIIDVQIANEVPLVH
jgi:hypothetical protein